MCVLPLFHANAFGFSLVASIYSGNHVILCNGLPLFRAVPIMRDEHVNIMSAVPQIIHVLAEKPDSFADLPHLKYLVSAAAPLRKDVAKRFYRNTGIPVRQGYGLSECVNFAATTPGDLPRSTYEKLMFDWQVPSIGTAVFGCELRIQRLDGSWAEPHEEGEIVVSGHNVMLGYWRSAEATIAAVGDGFLRTGDLGFFAMVDGEKNFFITGRCKEIIIRSGLNVSPLSIERELLDVEKIGEFAVAGFVNEAAGEEIGLYIVGDHTRENEERVLVILSNCVTQYRPGVVVFGKQPIPATPTGKIKRQLLSQRFRQFRGRVLGHHPIIGSYVEEMAEQ
jgi:long-chain acyl-CoA synthetase